jgi:hypothetical protein
MQEIPILEADDDDNLPELPLGLMNLPAILVSPADSSY